MAWSVAPKHQESELSCEKRESRKNYLENGEKARGAKISSLLL